EDAARVVPVEIVVVRAVAVENHVLDDDVLDELPAQDGEQRRRRRAALQPQVLAQRLVELEAIARASDERALDNDGAGIVGVLAAQTDAVANAETGGIGERDLLIVPVGIEP